MKFKVVWVVVLVWVGVYTGWAQSYEDLLPRGPHAVGLSFRYIPGEGSGSTTAGLEKSGRKIWVWYPAEDPGKAMPLTYAQLLEHTAPQYDAAWFWAEPLQVGADSLALGQLLSKKTQSYWDAKPLSDERALIIFLPGRNHPAFINTEMMERLASHGYVVASTSYGWPDDGLSIIDHQVQDVEQMIGVLSKEPMVGGEVIALMGHSAGGVGALVASMRLQEVDAFVSLDGSFVSKEVSDVIRDEIGRGVPKLQKPGLYTFQRWWRQMGNIHPNYDETIFDEIAGRGFILDFKHMEHPDFVSFDRMRFQSVDYAKFNVAYDVEKAQRGYEITVRYIKAFLDAFLQEDARAESFLQQGATDQELQDDLVFELINH